MHCLELFYSKNYFNLAENIFEAIQNGSKSNKVLQSRKPMKWKHIDSPVKKKFWS